MSGVSSSSTLAVDKTNDSVEKDFTKLKDLVGEEDNTVKKLKEKFEQWKFDQDDLDGEKKTQVHNTLSVEKLKGKVEQLKVDKDDSVGEKKQVHNTLSDREIFDKWCKVWRAVYPTDDEKEYRFHIFQKALKPPIPEEQRGMNYSGLADQTERELNGLQAYMFKTDIDMLDKLEEIFKKQEEQHGPFPQTEEEELDEELDYELDEGSELIDCVRIENDGDNYYIHYY